MDGRRKRWREAWWSLFVSAVKLWGLAESGQYLLVELVFPMCGGCAERDVSRDLIYVER